MSQPTARCHARALLENRNLQAERTHVFPVGLIDPEDSALVAALASAGRAATLATVFESPGISFQELADRVHLTRQSVSNIAFELSGSVLVLVADDARHR